MIYDIVKSKEYKQYKMITFLWDLAITFLAIAIGLPLIGTVGLVLTSFVTWTNYFIIVGSEIPYSYYWYGLRIVLIVSCIIALGVNSKSHQSEMNKLSPKK